MPYIRADRRRPPAPPAVEPEDAEGLSLAELFPNEWVARNLGLSGLDELRRAAPCRLAAPADLTAAETRDLDLFVRRRTVARFGSWAMVWGMACAGWALRRARP